MKNLYLVSTPIGNYDDITIRAINVLKDVDLIVCEEYKEARRLLSHYGIEKELISLNEHNERESLQEVISEIKRGKSVAVISDCGTPLFSDPGHLLVADCIAAGIKITPVPGASSLLPALIGTGLDFEKFFHYGWLSPKKEIRRQELKKIKAINEVIVLMDTPYRLRTLLRDVSKVMGENTEIVLAYELTKPKEKFYRGRIKTVLETAEKETLKGEFVLVVNNKRQGRKNKS